MDALQVNLFQNPSRYLGLNFKLKGRRVVDFEDLVVRLQLKGYTPKSFHSWTWRAIANPQSTELHKGRWIVGVGHQIPLIHPDWFQASSTLRELNLTNGTVADLIVPNP